MKKFIIKATSLRLLMIIAIILITAGAVVSFYLVQSALLKSALEKKDETPGSSSTNLSSHDLKALKEKISSFQNTISKTSTISVIGSKYQDQAIKDLNKYASLSGVIIDGGFSFTRPVSSEASSKLTFGALTTMPVVITLVNPVPIANFIKFLKLIESNLPIMQITGINISRASNSKNDITTDPLTIEILTRDI